MGRLNAKYTAIIDKIDNIIVSTYADKVRLINDDTIAYLIAANEIDIEANNAAELLGEAMQEEIEISSDVKATLKSTKAKLKFSKIIFDDNSEEQVPLVINNLNVGTYTLGTYSKWYSQRLDKGERTIPNVGKFVNGLLMQKFGIDTRNWGFDNNILENDLKIIGCNSIGEWFDKYMESNID